MDIMTLLLIVLIVMAIGSAPTWPHSRNWGYYPASGSGLLVIVLLVLILSPDIVCKIAEFDLPDEIVIFAGP